MALDGRSQLYKCILFVINIVLGLIGFAIMVLGMWVRFSAQTSGFFSVDLNTTSIVTVVTLLIVLGLLMMVISAFGNYGTCKESKGALTVVIMLLGFQLIFAIAAGTLATMKSEEAGELLLHAYTTTYVQYVAKGGDPSMAIMLHFVHNMFGCCGSVGGLDPLVKQMCPKKGFLESFTVPILALICSIYLRKGISSSSDPSYNITVSTTVQANL
ncbi:CD9 antigen-like isoform X2 [Paramormyrops kingsleyae]|uniref:CD9 antigen-like isoform X2 n=1 Tax=Paramormyrops kingsleyae TaxID=1676925 RepID=UPI003B972C18